MELQEGKTYIVKNKGWLDKSVSKVKILEKTQTSVLVESLDTNQTERLEILDFNTKYKVLEEMGGGKELLLG